MAMPDGQRKPGTNPTTAEASPGGKDVPQGGAKIDPAVLAARVTRIGAVVVAVLTLVGGAAVAVVNRIPEKALCKMFSTCEASGKEPSATPSTPPFVAASSAPHPVSDVPVDDRRGGGNTTGRGGADGGTAGNTGTGGSGRSGGSGADSGDPGTGSTSHTGTGTGTGTDVGSGTGGGTDHGGSHAGTDDGTGRPDPEIADPGRHAGPSTKDMTWTRTMSVTVEDIGDYADTRGELMVTSKALTSQGAAMSNVGAGAVTYERCATARFTLTEITFATMQVDDNICVDNDQYYAVFTVKRLPSAGSPYLWVTAAAGIPAGVRSQVRTSGGGRRPARSQIRDGPWASVCAGQTHRPRSTTSRARAGVYSFLWRAVTGRPQSPQTWTSAFWARAASAWSVTLTRCLLESLDRVTSGHYPACLDHPYRVTIGERGHRSSRVI